MTRTLNHTAHTITNAANALSLLLCSSVAASYRFSGKHTFRLARYCYATHKRVSVSLACNPKVPWSVWNFWFRHVPLRFIGRNLYPVGRDLYACAQALDPKPKKLTKRQAQRYRDSIASRYNAPSFAYSGDLNTMIYRMP